MTAFELATGLFLADYMSKDEVNRMLDKGECLPVCQDYEDWDTDYLLKKIEEVESTILKYHNKNQNYDN